MADYRLYTVTREGRVVGPAVVVRCNDDNEAIRAAQKQIAQMPIEIWRDNKKVGLISP